MFQDAPPNTSGYMILGYSLFFAISVIYLISLAVRRRNLEQDLHTLESMRVEAKSRGGPARGRSAARGPKPQKRKNVTKR